MIRIGEYLVEKGIITSDELQLALHRQLIYGGRIGTNLIKLTLITEEVLISLLQRAHNAKGINLRKVGTLPKSAVAAIDGETAKYFRCIPFEVSSSRAKIAVLDPLQKDEIRQIENKIGKNIEQYLFPEVQWIEAMQDYYNIDPTADEDILRDQQIPEKNDSEQVVQIYVDEQQEDADTMEFLKELRPKLKKSDDSAFADLDEIEKMLDDDNSLSQPISHAEDDTEFLSLDLLLDDKDFFTDYKDKTGWKRPKIKEPTEGIEPEKISMAEATIMLARARNREQIAITLLNTACNYVDNAILFFVKPDQISGWMGIGKEIEKDDITNFSFSLLADSFFLDAIKSSRTYRGPILISPTNHSIFKILNISWPSEVSIIPITVIRRVVALLYLGNIEKKIDEQTVTNMEILARKAAISFEILILKQKKEQERNRQPES